MPVTVKSDDMTLRWECARCHVTAEQALTNIAEVGTPICESCGNDMVLDDEVLISEPVRLRCPGCGRATVSVDGHCQHCGADVEKAVTSC